MNQWFNYHAELDTDRVMKRLWLTLHEDFQNTYGSDLHLRAHTALLKEGVKGFRDASWPSRPSSLPPHLYKWLYQLENLFKRYRFADDVYSDDELLERTVNSFRDTQVRIATPIVMTSSLFLVVQRARKIVTEILGDYDPEEHIQQSEFGKRACVGTPYRESYLDLKLQSRPFTGSPEHLRWFEDVIKGDPLLRECLKDIEQRTHPVQDLIYTCVPKDWKKLRGILANTLVGSYYSAGIGKVIQRRLLRAGLNIRRLQVKHGKLAKIASIWRRLVTADLSAASDSITLQLLRMLLPCKWYRAITYGRSRYADVFGERILLSSFLTMGLGTTFPLQTLIFYSLVRAMGELSGHRFSVSVYGDDLIYSRELHKYVKHYFPMLHLKLNADKTYEKDHFRESCGSDYYRGVDVRPYQPEGRCQHLVGPRKQEFLYRLYNGLRRRWDEVEIPKTLAYLRMELLMHGELLFQVPPSFPDGSGIRVDKPVKDYWYSPVLWRKSDKLRVADNGGGYCFMYLHDVSKTRCVQAAQLPYYWDKLRSKSQPGDVDNAYGILGLPTGEYLNSWDDAADMPVIQWVKAQKKPKYVRSSITGRKLRRTVAMVTRKGATVAGTKEARYSDWQ